MRSITVNVYEMRRIFIICFGLVWCSVAQAQTLKGKVVDENLRSIEVVSNPSHNGVDVRSVVRIRAIKRQGKGFGYAITRQANIVAWRATG